MKNKFTQKWRQLTAQNKQALTTRTAKVGGYSFALGVVVLAILVAVSFAASAAAEYFLPMISDGLRTIVLTLAISAAAALLRPVKQEENHDA